MAYFVLIHVQLRNHSLTPLLATSMSPLLLGCAA